jgi:hypothetical protein
LDRSREPIGQVTRPPRFRLALTGSMQTPFDTTGVDCEALRELPGGRLILRDLNGDQVPDFVIGTETGIGVFLNEPDGVRQMLDFGGPYRRGALINVGTADFNGDGRVDLVASWDSPVAESGIDISVMTVLFVQSADGALTEQGRRTSDIIAAAPEGPFIPGYFAVGKFDDGVSAILRRWVPQHERRFALQTRFGSEDRELLLPDEVEDEIDFVFTLNASGNDRLLAVGRDAAYVLTFEGNALDLVTQVALAFPGFHVSHEGGGGPERPSMFTYDIDRDGDLDFLETNVERTQLALHLNFGNQQLDAAQLFDVTIRGGAELPFLRLGPGTAIVGNAISESPPAVYTLITK